MIANSWALISVLGMLTAYGPVSIDLYLPAFSEMARDLSVTPPQIQYSMTSFFAGLSVGQLFYGPISDKIGRKKPLLFGITLFMVTSLLIAYAKSIESLVVLRFIQAFGSCVGMVLTRAIIRDSFEFKDIPKVFSLIILIMGVSPIFAPLLGNQILYFSSWRGIFIFLVFFGLLTFMGTSIVVKESLKESIPLKQSFKNYFYLFLDKQFLISSVVSGLVMAGMFSYISCSSIVFIDVFKVSRDIYPLLFGLNAFGFILVTQINIRLLNRYPLEKILDQGINLLFFNVITLGLVTYFKLSVWFFEGSLFLVFACLGIVMPNITAKALEFQSTRAGVASALMGSLQFFIASLGTILVTKLSHLETWAMVIGLLLFIGLGRFLYLFIQENVPEIA